MRNFWLGMVIVCLSIAVVADDAPIPEKSETRVVIAFQKAVISTIAAQQAEEKKNKDVSDFNAIVDDEVRINKLPKGTKMNVNVDTGKVILVAPPLPVNETPKAAK